MARLILFLAAARSLVSEPPSSFNPMMCSNDSATGWPTTRTRGRWDGWGARHCTSEAGHRSQAIATHRAWVWRVEIRVVIAVGVDQLPAIGDFGLPELSVHPWERPDKRCPRWTLPDPFQVAVRHPGVLPRPDTKQPTPAGQRLPEKLQLPRSIV
jgi:hypothetical protein